METHAFTLPAQAPFAFDLILHSLRNSAGTILEQVTEDEYRRALTLDGRPALLTVQAAGSELAPELRVAVTAESGAAGLEAAARQRVAHIFGTAVDSRPVDAIEDPVFQAAWAGVRGFRPIQVPGVFEAIAWAIIGQQINVTFAARCKRALTETYGGRLEVQGYPYLLFPAPEALAPLEESALLALQFSRQKARYILGLARAIVDGRFDVDGLSCLPADEALARLMELVGVGRWTAEYVLLRGLAYPDSLPAGDVALQRSIGRAYGLDRLATEAEVRAYGERWGPWRSYASVTWWHMNLLERLKAGAGKGQQVGVS